ncbi:uncharacterized protein LOC143428021 [Xylocopa sonorina]|uniref:uncharacterized protein LOC143428021 n=1 Tax=Xylocopa sonorina TaxID=1818115 RepID=UPI00403B1EEA
MADNEKIADHDGQKSERSVGRLYARRSSEQRALPKTKYKTEENELPAPPPDPWASPWRQQNSPCQTELTKSRNLEEDDDMIDYLTGLGSLPFEGQISGCSSRNSAVSAVAASNPGTEDVFEHLDRLYAFVEQILELRNRSSKFFKRVRNLERLKVLRNANNKLENSFARDKDVPINILDEDTGFAESLLDAMLANCRDSPFQRRNIRSSSRQTRDKPDAEKQTSTDEISRNAPKVSKWTRVKAAFKWERAYTNDAEIVDPSMTNVPTTATTTTTTPLLSPTTKFLRIPDEIRESSNTVVSSFINEPCNLGTPCGRNSSASSSNEGYYECSQKSVQSDDQSPKRKTNKKTDCSNWCSEPLDNDIIASDRLNANETDTVNEVDQERSSVRNRSEKKYTMPSSNRMDEKYAESLPKRSTPTLTITIAPQEEDNVYTSSSETNSPLLFNSSIFGGSSPQQRKMYRDRPVKDFKRQQSLGGESTILPTKAQRQQDSKWNKVRRAFLTNSSLSVPSSLINVVPRQTLFQHGLEASTSCNYDENVENIEKTIPFYTQVDTLQDYRALREKFGTEFQQKLVEWERLKKLSPRAAGRDSRETSSNSRSPRDSLLSEERLAPEFRKKLQDWKRVKKARRGSAPFEQQRLNRRRLTDWQLWRSPLKPEYSRNKDGVGFSASCESNETVSDGKSQTSGHHAKPSESYKFENASAIDESEFFVLERLLSRFNDSTAKGWQKNDARQLDECFDGYTRYNGTQNVNDTSEILVRTSVGSYRFEGISREFTRKLYDWERYRGISPTSSTFRLLGPTYTPFLRQAAIETSTDESPAKTRSDESMLFKVSPLKRSKSVGSLTRKPIQSEFYIGRSNSLQSLDQLTDRLKNANCFNTSPTSIDPQRTDDATEDIMDDSEPEAMIVDIEDVIEETASPLERVQPHQTPVYSVATSETISIAVPLGTVTSSHEPSPVCLMDIEENVDCKYRESKSWNETKSLSSEDSLSMEQFDMSKSCGYNEVNSKHSSLKNLSDKATRSVKGDNDSSNRESDKDSVKSNSLINFVELDSEYDSMRPSKKILEDNCLNFKRDNVSMVLPNDKHASDEISFTIAQSELASCRYNQELSNKNEDKRGITNHENSDDREDAAVITIKNSNELERVMPAVNDPQYCSLTNLQSVANYNEEATSTLTETLPVYKLDPAKRICNVNFCYTNRKEENLKQLDESYAAISDESPSVSRDASTIKLNQDNRGPSGSCIEYSYREKETSCSNGGRTSVQRTNENEWQGYENISSPSSRREPTIQTTACTVLPRCEERSLERIVINEDTLNKIVVPTASTGCIEKADTSKEPIDSASIASTEEQHHRSSCDRDVPINQESNTRKPVSSSPTRNVFIRTKRIIFSPFRRSEEHSVTKKETNACENDRICLMKDRTKCRSVSPKINRQDTLLRMSLPLPWPLRPLSKEREIKERKIDESTGMTKVEQTLADKQYFIRRKSTENTRKSSESESSACQTPTKNGAQIMRDRNSSFELSGNDSDCKRSIAQKNQRMSISERVASEEQQNQASFRTSSKIEEQTRETTPSSKFDPQASDLIHKLTILSNAVAKRDGRTSTISEDSPLESHSSRIRRAKEDFLSRRGGPLCHSVLDPSSSTNQTSLKSTCHYYEQISQNCEKTENKVVPNEGSNNRVEQQETTRGEATEQPASENEGNESNASVASRPDRVKSASAGMINRDPDAYVHSTEASRGCESLPRTISKQQPLGSLAKIVSKFKFSRLIRNKDIPEESMSTIAKLCRQSLLIDVRNDFEKHLETSDREETPKMDNGEKMRKDK